MTRETWSIKDVADTFERHGLIIEQEPSGDLISRQAVIDALYDIEVIKYRIDIENVIKALPPVNPQPTGHWKSTIDGKPICSECGFVSESEDGYFVSRYCPNCGCRMVNEQKSDHTCHTCKHYTKGERDGSCGSYICKGYSNWESEDKE